MKRLDVLTALALLFAGCEEEESLPESPPMRCPGRMCRSRPKGRPQRSRCPPGPRRRSNPPLAVPGEPSPLPMPQPPMPPGMQPGQVPPGAMQPTAPLSLGAGFTPDPHIERGVSVGQIQASQMTQRQDCAGYISAQPNRVLVLGAPFPKLRVMVASETDTVLVIRKPDGSYFCNDDTDPGVVMNPTVEEQFAPGTYSVWVGTYGQGETAPYVLGITTDPSLTHETLVTNARPGPLKEPDSGSAASIRSSAEPWSSPRITAQRNRNRWQDSSAAGRCGIRRPTPTAGTRRSAPAPRRRRGCPGWRSRGSGKCPSPACGTA